MQSFTYIKIHNGYTVIIMYLTKLSIIVIYKAKAEIEGTLLLYTRNSPDSWAFIILNKLHANNYRQICSDIESFNMEDNLLMFNTRSGIYKSYEEFYPFYLYDKDQFLAFGYTRRRIRIAFVTGLRGLSIRKPPWPLSNPVNQVRTRPSRTFERCSRGPRTNKTSSDNSSPPPPQPQRN